ncbi:PSP1 C-terminal conserved region containing protein, putative [Leishmania lindenbergi]|uniref:PSP1 C-terminal conserved region containing protein n=1 Tax=Leishmania lindenbergi TaxID=651832 RepID=A0AAW3A1F7_9TRYP
MSPLEVLSEMKMVNDCLQLLSEQLHMWVEMSSPAAICASRSPIATNACGSDAHGYSANFGATQAALPWCVASEREALYCLQSVMDNARRFIIQSQSELWTVLSLRAATTSPSTATSGQASCGISCAESLSDEAKRCIDAWVCPSDAEQTEVPLMRVMKRSPSRSALALTPERIEVRDTSRTPANAIVTSRRLPDRVADHLRRRSWPATQFCYMTHVEFKRGRLRRFLSPVTVTAGTYVIVPGDRGYDCGLVVQCALWNPHKQAYELETLQSLDPGVLPPGDFGPIMEIIRVATDKEVHRLHREHVRMERLALTACRDIADRLHLPMEVLDCEYQYDGTKISFFFDSTEVIDFRQLNKELFRIFNARIWMQNTNAAVRNEAPRGLVAQRQMHGFRSEFKGTSSRH